jgi:hypothetical protein
MSDMPIDSLMNWHHSGLNLCRRTSLWPGDQKMLENLSRYIIRAPFFQDRMTNLYFRKMNDKRESRVNTDNLSFIELYFGSYRKVD